MACASMMMLCSRERAVLIVSIAVVLIVIFTFPIDDDFITYVSTPTLSRLQRANHSPSSSEAPQ